MNLALLEAVPRTLLIPLAARACGQRLYPWLNCQDAEANSLLACLQVPAGPLLEDWMVVLNVLWRTRVLKQWGEAFFRQTPLGTGITLGAGLSHHFQWLDFGHNQWVDADLAPVHALRDRLIHCSGRRHRHRAIDLQQAGWWDDVTQGLPAQPCWVLCEGVLMYFNPQQVCRVLREFAESAPPGSRFVLDAISHVGVGQARRSLSVSRTGAEFRWGLHDLRELLDIHPRLRLVATRSAAECYGWWGWAAETACMPWTGTPLYSMVMLEAV
jgi:O-methyltransferase involved in polyketide biosynthesis